MSIACATYPAHREADVALRDGSTVHVRPVRHSDQPDLLRFLEGLSRDSVGLRFFSAGVDLRAAAKWAAQVDYRDRFGLLALTGADHRIVGHAVYQRTGTDRAEVAFEVADAFQGQGLGTILLAHLAEAAEEQGVRVFEAEVLPAEPPDDRGVPRERICASNALAAGPRGASSSRHRLSPDAIERFEERERSAAAAAIATTSCGRAPWP